MFENRLLKIDLRDLLYQITGDIIVKVDEVQIKSFSDLTGYLGSKRPNEKVEVTYLRNSKKNKVSVTLKKLSIAEIYGMKLKNCDTKR